jgi:plasmid stability protein
MQYEEHKPIATLTIRNIQPELKEALRVRAARHGHSMEAELRSILRAALANETTSQPVGLATAIHRRFAPLGGVELESFPDEPVREPPRFE